MYSSLQLQGCGKLTARSLVATMADRGTSRIYVADISLNMKFLIDTGADVSVIPRPKNFSTVKGKLTLYAANNTPISTYGTKLITLNHNLRRPFSWPFIVADVSTPIVGVDFLKHFKRIYLNFSLRYIHEILYRDSLFSYH